jgi:hypothetical protein
MVIILKNFYNKPITMIEFGIFHGGSLKMWQTVFDENSKIFGADINPLCKQVENGNIKVFIGNQENRIFLKEMMGSIGCVDLIIEDGGHEMNQQINTFEETFSYLKNNGTFLIEDLHTSYYEGYGGGFKREGTFIEFTKALITNFFKGKKTNFKQHSMVNEIQIDKYKDMIKSIHILDSVVVFEKNVDDVNKEINLNFDAIGTYKQINNSILLTFDKNIDYEKHFKKVEYYEDEFNHLDDVDIVIDSGNSGTQDVINRIDKLFNNLKDNSIYIIRDLDKFDNNKDLLEFLGYYNR